MIDRLARAHVGRDAELARLRAHAASVREPCALVVTGEPGAGKSSLLAAWIAGADSDGPPESRRQGWAAPFFRGWLGPGRARGSARPFTVAHFVLASAVDATNVGQMLGRLIEVLGARFGFQIQATDDPIGLASAFASALYQAAANAPVVVVLDGLDQLDRRGQGLGLAWLPEQLPRRVRLVISTSAGPVLDELLARG